MATKDLIISWLPAQEYGTPICLNDNEYIEAVAWNTWTTAVMTAQVSNDNGVTWYELLNADLSYTLNAKANSVHVLTSDERKSWSKFPLIRFRSGSLASPVNQHATNIHTMLVKLGVE